MERRYLAIVDNGHERFRVDYYSIHRICPIHADYKGMIEHILGVDK